MRCCCCNTNLNDYESTLRSMNTGEFLDMCRKCLKDLDIPTKANFNEPEEEVVNEEHYWDDPNVEFLPFADPEDE